MSARYKVNSPKVIHEEIQGEVVVINLDTGAYYSLVGSGSVIWEKIVSGMILSQVVEEVDAHYAGDAKEIETSVESFSKQLTDEGLVVPNLDAESMQAVHGGSEDSKDSSKGDSQKTKFEAAILEKFTDMQEMLLLDPIHDVDESGWPEPAQE